MNIVTNYDKFILKSKDKKKSRNNNQKEVRNNGEC